MKRGPDAREGRVVVDRLEVLGLHAEVEGARLAPVTEVQEQFSQGTIPTGSEVKVGDRFRLSGGKIRIVLLPLSGGARDTRHAHRKLGRNIAKNRV